MTKKTSIFTEQGHTCFKSDAKAFSTALKFSPLSDFRFSIFDFGFILCFCSLALILFSIIATSTNLNYSNEIKEKSLEGTENTNNLTYKQLAIQRWFSNLTFLNHRSSSINYQPSTINQPSAFSLQPSASAYNLLDWKGWYMEPKQLGLESNRYHLAFLGYAAAVMVYKTPAYREVSIQILDDVIKRLLDKGIWEFIQTYWADSPYFPDPVAFENIMYSGHLAQMIALYESISGDMKYSTQGFDFIWDEKTKIHYTAEKLMQKIYDQIKENEEGGVPCEPDIIFVICNDHPQNAFLLYDAIHNTHFSDIAEKWRKWMEANALLPENKSKDYLKISYLHSKKMWTTGFGLPGADGWSLAWMYPWTSNPDFVIKGWKKMKNNNMWRKDKNGGEYLKTDAKAKMVGIDDAASTSFYTLVENQCSTNNLKNKNAYLWFENKFGKLADEDSDGFRESYYYNTDIKSRIWITANLAIAMLTSGDSLRNMYRAPFFKKHENEPFLEHIAYPEVIVKQAAYDIKNKTLNVVILPGNNKSLENTTLTFSQIPKKFTVLRNGKEWKNYKYENNILLINTSLDNEVEFKISIHK